MRPVVKLLLVTVPLVAAGIGTLVYFVATSPPPQRTELAERTTQIRAIVARDQPVTPRIIAFGLVRPARTYEAIAQVAGSVDYVNPELRKGAILPAGSVLVRLSPADFNLAIAQANANIRATEARLAELIVSEENQTAALRIEQETLALKEADLKRAEDLLSRGTVPKTTRDAARAALLAQRQKVQAVESTLALLPTQRAVQSEQIAVYQANLETARLNLARTELTLPFDARVASVSVEIGQFVGSGKSVAILDGIEAAEVEAQVPIGALRELMQSARISAEPFSIEPSRMTEILRRLGLVADVRLRLGGDFVSWPATVDRISDTIDQTSGTLGMIVRVDTAYSATEPGNRPPLTKGMFVEVSLRTDPVIGIVVPRNALRDGQLLIADQNDRLAIVPVAFSLVQDEIALITDGIRPDTRIVVSTPSPAVPGMLLGVTIDTELMDTLMAQGQAE